MLSLAGAGELGLTDMIPKGALVTATLALLGFVLFFVKRDYARINAHLEKNGSQVGGLEKKVDANHNAVMLELNDCIKVKDFSPSMNRIHNRVNRVVQRQVVVETKLGMHEEVLDEHKDGEDEV